MWPPVVENATGNCIVKKKIFSEVATGKYFQRGWAVNAYWYSKKQQ